MAKLSMDGFLRSVKLIPDKDDDRYDDDYDDYEEDEEFDEEEEPAPKKSVKPGRFSRNASRYDDRDEDYEDDEEEAGGSYYSAPGRSQQAVSKAVNASAGSAAKGAKSGKASANPGDINVRIFHPKTIEDANTIADELVSEKIVVMNLEEVDMAAAQRIVDFVSGACYSVDGNLQKIAKKAFIVTPKNANLSSEMGNIIKEAVGLNSVNIMR